MTFKEEFDNEPNWKRKCFLVEFFHLKQLMLHPGWRVRDTARAFKHSMGLISENLMLAQALKDGKLDNCTSRQNALKELKK